MKAKFIAISISFGKDHSLFVNFVPPIFHESRIFKNYLGTKIYPLRVIHDRNTLPIHEPYNELYCLEVLRELYNEKVYQYAPYYYGNHILQEKCVHMFKNEDILDKFKSSDEAIDDLKKLRDELSNCSDSRLQVDLQNRIQYMENISLVNNKTMVVFMDHRLAIHYERNLDALLYTTSTFGFIQSFIPLFYQGYVLSLQKIYNADLHMGNVLLWSMYGLMNNGMVPTDCFVVPKLKKEYLDKNYKGGDALADLIATADKYQFADHSVKSEKGIYRAKYDDEGELKLHCLLAEDQSILVMIDYSRSVIFNQDALAGIQPFKASLREEQYRNIFGALEKYLSKFDQFKSQELFLEFCVEHPDHIFSAINGSDLLIYICRYYYYYKERLLKVGFDKKVKFLEDVIAFMEGELLRRVELLLSHEFELLRNLPLLDLIVLNKFFTDYTERPKQINDSYFMFERMLTTIGYVSGTTKKIKSYERHVFKA